jgi:glucose-6-phosphate isomerase
MNLREYIGLPIASDNKTIKYNSNEIDVKSVIITETKDIEFFLKEKDSLKEEEVFRVYQTIRSIEDKELWDDISFDIIVIQPGKLGKEYMKTIGYYRSCAENGYCYPEVYQIAEGYVEFFLQQPSQSHEKIKDAVMIRAQRFDVIVVPPAYGVTLINPSEKKAIIARIRAMKTEEISKQYKQTHGECYYRMENDKWDFNETYEEIPMLRLEEPQNKWKSLKRGIPIYASYTYNPKRFNGLVKPDPFEFIL